MQRRARTEKARGGLHKGRAGLGDDLSPPLLLRVRQETTLEDHLDRPPGGCMDDRGNITLDEVELLILELADGNDHVDLVGPVLNG